MPKWQHPSIYASSVLRSACTRRPSSVRPVGARFGLALLPHAAAAPALLPPLRYEHDLHGADVCAQPAHAGSTPVVHAVAAAPGTPKPAPRFVRAALVAFAGRLATLVRPLLRRMHLA